MNTLGIRNKNPFNIRYNTAIKWKGQIGQYKGFCRFSSMDYGIRSGLSLLRTYRYLYGLDTIRKIISRYAPSNENNTDYYISFVVGICRQYGFSIDADTSLNLDFYDYKGVGILFYIVRAILLMESKYFLEPPQFEKCLKMLHN